MRTQAEWETFYESPDPWSFEGGIEDVVRTQALIQRIRHAQFKHGIDLGCGEGHLTNELSKVVGRIDGYDISETALVRARARFPHIDFRQGDLLDVIRRPEVLAEPFDFVSVAEMLYYLESDDERLEAVTGLAQLGCPNCVFFISVIVNSGGGTRRYFRHDEFLQLLSREFMVIESFSALATLPLPLRAMRKLAPSRTLRLGLTRAWTHWQTPEHCKHAGYLAVKRDLH